MIIGVKGRQIFDSRGKPTVEVDVMTEVGMFRANVPSGVSASHIHECLEVRDHGPEFRGKGLQMVLHNVNHIIGPELIKRSMDPRQQLIVDAALNELDSSDDKSIIGVNAIAPASMAVCRAGAAQKGIPLYQHIAGLMGIRELILPIPVFTVLSGGIHSGNDLPFQEFSVIPEGARTYTEAMRMGSELFHHLKQIIQREYGSDATNVGDLGAYSPPVRSVDEALGLLMMGIEESGYSGKVKIAIDAAASEFYRDKKYNLHFKTRKSKFRKTLQGESMLDMYLRLIAEYPISVLEDPFSHDDWKSFAELTAACNGGPVAILGDDLTTTNCDKISMAVRRKACNGFLIKLNQIGTVTEVFNACHIAHEQNWTLMVSHRSGDTLDPFISDLAVGVQAMYIKAGAPCRAERTSKYNQLLRIEDDLGVMATYAGTQLIYATEV